jgi:hypothetical protein
MIENLDERIRRRAHKLWEENGQRKGRAEDYRDLARQLIAIEDGQDSTLQKTENTGPYGEPLEESAIQDNLGEFPTETDQGEDETYPRADNAIEPEPEEPKPEEPKPPRRKH